MNAPGLPEPVRITLRDGTDVVLRPARSDDRDRLVAAFSALDRETVYTRFFGYRNELTAAELARLGDVDFARRGILLATVGGGDGETVVGSASYVVDVAGTGPTSAEIAFVVEEDYQGRGLASWLLKHLARAARANGIARFDAVVLGDNAPMLRVFERCGLPVTRSRRDGDVVVALDLTGEPATRGG
jgi:RimJ/RimL family protein N-acetyltransferase